MSFLLLRRRLENIYVYAVVAFRLQERPGDLKASPLWRVVPVDPVSRENSKKLEQMI